MVRKKGKSMKTLSIILVVLFICTSLTAGEELSARQIADRSFEATRLSGAEATSTMTISDSKGRERIRKIAQVTKLYDSGDTEKKLIRFLAPADVKGTGMLTFDYKVKDDDIWLYMPALRKTRRIVSSEKAKSFMGSEFSYADMTPPNFDDFSFKLLGEQIINGTSCWQIEMIPNDDDIADENGFSKKISFIGKDDFVIRKAIYYDLDESLLKELSVKEIKLLDPANKKYRPMEMEMINRQNDRRSTLVIDKIQFNPNVKDEFFTTRYLERE